MSQQLDPRPVRALTDREIVTAIGALIGGYCQTSNPSDVRAAVRWLADTDEFWQALERILPACITATERSMSAPVERRS